MSKIVEVVIGLLAGMIIAIAISVVACIVVALA